MLEKTCDHKSVGMLVWKDGKLLLIERGQPPFGFAVPAGHLDVDSFEAGAKRELKEEVGLDAIELKLLLEEKVSNICRRKNSTWHYWRIYEAKVKGKVQRSLDETKQAGWYSLAEIKNLSNRTKEYLEGKIKEEEWEDKPGIEPVWYDWFRKLRIL